MQHAIFSEFVDVCFSGNQSAAAAALGVDRSTVSRICSGDRGVTPEMAAKAEELSDGRYRREVFIWPESRDVAP